MPPKTTPSKPMNDDHRRSDSAILHLGAHARLWMIAVSALGVDLWTKSWVFDNLKPSEVQTAIPSLLTIRRSVNSGALFGMGKGMVPIFIAASFVALAFVLYLFACSRRNHRLLHLALSFVLAGSLGNLYDRVFVIADRITFVDGSSQAGQVFLGKVVGHDDSGLVQIGSAPDGKDPKPFRRSEVEISQVGVVRDFLKIEPRIAGVDVWPWIFNVADSLLVVGVGMLMLNFWLEHRRQQTTAAGDLAGAAP